MKTDGIDYRTALWKGRGGRLWRIADRLEETARLLRYARKPYDLVFPTTRITDLTNQIREIQWEWLAERIGLDPKSRGRWPHI